MDEFYRLLDSNDVARKVRVDVVDECGKCGGLAGSGRAGNEYETGAHFPKTFDLLGNIEFLKREDFGGNDTEHTAVSALLFHVVAAESRIAVHFVCEVCIAALLVAFPKLGVAYGLHELHHILVGKNVLGNRLNIAVDADFWRLPFRKMKVRAAALHEFLEIGVNFGIHESDRRR